jgi:virginiamycin B lyase
VLAKVETGSGSRPCSVAFAAGSAWASLFGTGEVVRIDPTTNTVIARVKVGEKPCGITAAAGAIWVGNYTGNSVMRIDPATNRVVKRFSVQLVYDVLVGHGSVWATSQNGVLYRISPKRNRVV